MLGGCRLPVRYCRQAQAREARSARGREGGAIGDSIGRGVGLGQREGGLRCVPSTFVFSSLAEVDGLRLLTEHLHLLGSLGPLSTDRGDGERHTGMAFEAGRTHPHLNSEQQEARDFSERNDDDVHVV